MRVVNSYLTHLTRVYDAINHTLTCAYETYIRQARLIAFSQSYLNSTSGSETNYLGPLLLGSACGGFTVASGRDGSGANDASVNTTRDAVDQGDEELGQGVGLIDGGILKISLG